MVNDIVRLMDHLQIRKAHVIGYSMVFRHAAWLKPNDVSRSNLLDGAARPLDPATTSCDDQSLTRGMRMPRYARRVRT